MTSRALGGGGGDKDDVLGSDDLYHEGKTHPKNHPPK